MADEELRHNGLNADVLQCSQATLLLLQVFTPASQRSFHIHMTQSHSSCWTRNGSQNNMSDETNGVNNAISCYKEAVHFSASFVTSPFASFWLNYVHIRLIKIVNTPVNRSGALVLSVTNWMSCNYIGIRQILPENWPEPDLSGFPKNGRMPDLPEPELKSGATLNITFKSDNFSKSRKYLSRLGAQTIARFLQVIPVFSFKDAMRDRCFIRNAQVLNNSRSTQQHYYCTHIHSAN